MLKTIRLVENKTVAVITATVDFDPLRKLIKITKELEKNNFKGSVVIDLFCRNGMSSNRFMTMSFDGRSLNRRESIVSPHIDSKLEAEQNMAFKQSPGFLLSSTLSKKEITEFLGQWT
jgi:hypothetical protein